MFGRRGENPVVLFWSTHVRIKHVDVVAMPDERLWAVGIFFAGVQGFVFFEAPKVGMVRRKGGHLK